MNRKEFIASLAVLGGSVALPSVAQTVLKQELEDLAQAAKRSKKLDDATTVLISDIHICGELKDGKSIRYPYNPTSLGERIKEILALRPLPANVLIFGDVAWDYGLEEDYIYVAELLKPLEEAGIKITMGLGNHDRRAPFFKVFPQYLQSTPVEGRAVSVVKLADVDFVMLDSLSEIPNLPLRKATTVGGDICDSQIEWLEGYLKSATRPVILGAHHPLNELTNLRELIGRHHNVAGFVNGHLHIWNKKASIFRPRDPERVIPVVELPATFYGDIGFAVMRTDSKCAKISFTSQGFWWPEPNDNPPAEWKARQDDLANEVATFIF